jgi:phosphoribosylformylglycinamidine (FGAM) synthase PurS component
VDGVAGEEHLAQAREMAAELLSNGVIEDVIDIRVEDSPA